MQKISLIPGGTTVISASPQNMYWQKTKCDKEGGNPAALFSLIWKNFTNQISPFQVEINNLLSIKPLWPGHILHQSHPNNQIRRHIQQHVHEESNH